MPLYCVVRYFAVYLYLTIKETTDMQITKEQNERVGNLLKLGVNFQLVSQSLGLPLKSTVYFLIEDYQYEKLMKVLVEQK